MWFPKIQGAPTGSPVIFGEHRQVIRLHRRLRRDENGLRYSPVTSSLIQVEA